MVEVMLATMGANHWRKDPAAAAALPILPLERINRLT
jgi:hypothetical protein